MLRMKKWLCLPFALVLLIALILPAACTAAEGDDEEEENRGSWSQINQSLEKGDGWQRIVTDPSAFQLGQVTPRENSDRLFTQAWGTYPSLDGSTVCVPLAMELARQWLNLAEEDLNGFVNFSTTPYAYDRLTRNEANPLVTIPSQGITLDTAHPVDIVLGTAPNTDEQAAAEEAEADLVMIPVCYDAFVFLVNSENPVDGLSADQIRQIYTGAVQLWSQVGGEPDLPIYPFQRPHGSGSQTAMEEMVMQGLRLSEAPEAFISDGMADLIAQIGNYSNSRQALGYSYLYYVESLYREGAIKVLAVDGVEPLPEHLRDGTYPFTVYYYAVYRRENENAARFADWLISDAGQRCVAQAGYIPLREVPEP